MRSMKNTEVKYTAQVLISEHWIKISTWYMKRWQLCNSVNMQNTTNTYTLNGWLVWHMTYVSTELFFKKGMWQFLTYAILFESHLKIKHMCVHAC